MKDNIIEFRPGAAIEESYDEPATFGEVIELAQQVSILHDEIQELSKINNQLIKLLAKQSTELRDMRQMILRIAQGQGNGQSK